VLGGGRAGGAGGRGRGRGGVRYERSWWQCGRRGGPGGFPWGAGPPPRRRVFVVLARTRLPWLCMYGAGVGAVIVTHRYYVTDMRLALAQTVEVSQCTWWLPPRAPNRSFNARAPAPPPHTHTRDGCSACAAPRRRQCLGTVGLPPPPLPPFQSPTWCHADSVFTSRKKYQFVVECVILGIHPFPGVDACTWHCALPSSGSSLGVSGGGGCMRTPPTASIAAGVVWAVPPLCPVAVFGSVLFWLAVCAHQCAPPCVWRGSDGLHAVLVPVLQPVCHGTAGAACPVPAPQLRHQLRQRPVHWVRAVWVLQGEAGARVGVLSVHKSRFPLQQHTVRTPSTATPTTTATTAAAAAASTVGTKHSHPLTPTHPLPAYPLGCAELKGSAIR
jgi:hypothetical protein